MLRSSSYLNYFFFKTQVILLNNNVGFTTTDFPRILTVFVPPLMVLTLSLRFSFNSENCLHPRLYHSLQRNLQPYPLKLQWVWLQKTVSTQVSFLANAAHKSRLIRIIIKKFQHHRINTRQAAADADSLIASTG